MRCETCGCTLFSCQCQEGPTNRLVELWPPPCIHGDGSNLCESCQACYDEDPSAYIEYGDHPDGLERWKAEEEAAAAFREEQERARGWHRPVDDIPF